MLLLLELVEDEVLEGLGESGSGGLAVADFLLGLLSARVYFLAWSSESQFNGSHGDSSYLDVTAHVILHRLERRTAEHICRTSQPLSTITIANYAPKSVCKLSAASRNSVVEILLSAAMGTSTKLLLRVSKKVDMVVISASD